jgi:hypothetical protein
MSDQLEPKQLSIVRISLRVAISLAVGAILVFLVPAALGAVWRYILSVPMKVLVAIAASWYFVGLVAYLFILRFFEGPAFDREDHERTHYPKVRVLPPLWNLVRLKGLFLTGLVVVPLAAPFFLLIFVCYKLRKPDNSRFE